MFLKNNYVTLLVIIEFTEKIMFNRFLSSTGHLFDKKLNNGTVMVVIISFCITITWIVIPTTSASLTANVLEAQKNTDQSQYVIIDGKKFKIILEEVK